MQAKDLNKHPLAFVIDIDGTLITNYHAITDAKQAIDLLNKNNIPIILLTNNVSQSEQKKADDLNQIIKPEVPFTGQQVILNTTPLKNAMEWHGKTVLVIGRQRKLNKSFLSTQIPLYITIEEYCTLFPQSVPLSARQLNQQQDEVKATKQRVYKRLGVQTLDKYDIKFDAILVANCPNKWEECYQIIMDHICTEDGSLSKQKEYSYFQNHIPIMTALNDLYFSTDKHNLPRLLIRPFSQGLKSVYRTIFNKEIKIQPYGKPEKFTYQYTIKHTQKYFGSVEKYVMIGDNEDTDILGAYNFGWQSILVKTGVTKHQSKMATYNCDSILEGIKKYVHQ